MQEMWIGNCLLFTIFGLNFAKIEYFGQYIWNGKHLKEQKKIYELQSYKENQSTKHYKNSGELATFTKNSDQHLGCC